MLDSTRLVYNGTQITSIFHRGNTEYCSLTHLDGGNIQVRVPISSQEVTEQFDKQGQEEFVIEYFRQVRGELTTRVQIHTNLVLQKVATCGAALGFLFSQKATSESLVSCEIQLLEFAIIPIIAMGYDVLIARNINALHRLGTFIRNELESLVSESLKLRLWETKYGQPENSLPRNHGVAEIRFLSLFTLATEITVTAIYWNKQPRYLFIPLIVILFLLHFYVFSYMKQQILQFDTFEAKKR